MTEGLLFPLQPGPVASPCLFSVRAVVAPRAETPQGLKIKEAFPVAAPHTWRQLQKRRMLMFQAPEQLISCSAARFTRNGKVYVDGTIQFLRKLFVGAS
jgi:hypothetical protein